MRDWSSDVCSSDLGCGHGLMLAGAAQRLLTGRVIGIDIWRSEDQARNSPEATLRNMRLEGVSERVEVRTADARDLPFDAGKIGRASCRERLCQYVSISVAAVSLKKSTNQLK